jgi:LPPG:FO 2-phospho-L-lactate transferase
MSDTPDSSSDILQIPKETSELKVVTLAGGVGGAKLADGLSQILPPQNLTIIGNTGDDFQHLGLTVCPDLDTVMYTLAGAADPKTGWGRAGDSWVTHEEIGRLGGPNWFQLGDLDLATHLVRTQMLNNQMTLTEVTGHLCQRIGAAATLLPMSDESAPTMVDCETGLMSFQTWFVEKRWQPVVKRVELPDNIKSSPEVASSIEQADIVIIAPSNPFVSIDPILNVYPIREMLADLPDLVIGVSPIIAGRAVKGPAAKLMLELGLEPSSAAVAHYYDPLLDVFVYDTQDDEDISIPDLVGYRTDTLMVTLDDRIRLAAEILTLSMELLSK